MHAQETMRFIDSGWAVDFHFLSQSIHPRRIQPFPRLCTLAYSPRIGLDSSWPAKRLGQTTGANDWGQRAVTAESLATPSDEQPTISWESVRAGTHSVGSGMRQDADLRSVGLGWRLAL